MKKYRFKQNTPFKNEDANAIGLFLEKTFPNDEITPDKVVESARSIKSPIHKYFDWDNDSAAKKWRLYQARRLLNCLYVEVDDRVLPAYESVYVSHLDHKSYASNERIGQNSDLWEQVVTSAKQQLVYWKLKYQNYREHFEEVFVAIERMNEPEVRSKKYAKEKTNKRSRVNQDTTHRS